LTDVKLPKYTEFEVKFKSDIAHLAPFCKIVESLPDLKNFLFAKGPDMFYTGIPNGFARYRRAQFTDKDGKHFGQFTIKVKPPESKNNIIRPEDNWDVSNNSPESIYSLIDKLGLKFNVKIFKTCYIYTFPDATLVFYTVWEDGSTKETHFIEIEVDEDTIHNLTESEAWGVINKYEKILEPIGITPQKRMKLSLFEMFRKETL
jgi:adenylate cyclase class IV